MNISRLFVELMEVLLGVPIFVDTVYIASSTNPVLSLHHDAAVGDNPDIDSWEGGTNK